jgi:hypothetical protein
LKNKVKNINFYQKNKMSYDSNTDIPYGLSDFLRWATSVYYDKFNGITYEIYRSQQIERINRKIAEGSHNDILYILRDQELVIYVDYQHPIGSIETSKDCIDEWTQRLFQELSSLKGYNVLMSEKLVRIIITPSAMGQNTMNILPWDYIIGITEN